MFERVCDFGIREKFLGLQENSTWEYRVANVDDVWRKEAPCNILEEKSEEAAVTTSSSVKTSAGTSASMGTDGRDDVVCIVSGPLHEPLKIALYDTLGNVGEALASVHISRRRNNRLIFNPSRKRSAN